MLPQPLAARMRPQTLEDIIGQQHIIGPESSLCKMLKKNMIPSTILYGPPGTGKTTIAHVIANTINAEFIQINAVQSGKKEMESACNKAMKNAENDTKTVLFIDEIHRFNKAQQDFLLPFAEQGIISLIGATTENPYFEVNNALISRSIVYELKTLTAEDIKTALYKALLDTENGLGNENLTLEDDAAHMIAEQANGDLRKAYNTLEFASAVAENNVITLEDVKKVLPTVTLRYDKDGDMHYDTISAFIKSMRGSDPDAVLYYLARMIQAGEDPKFIARRIMIHASEDVGNADPMALVLATSASLAAERIGFPEAQIILAQAAVYVAMSPKSNSSAHDIETAMAYVKDHPSNDVPNHLRDAHYKGAAKLGHGLDYKYPHDFPNHWIPQQYLPDSVKEQFYTNNHMGYEQVQADYQNKIRSNMPR